MAPTMAGAAHILMNSRRFMLTCPSRPSARIPRPQCIGSSYSRSAPAHSGALHVCAANPGDDGRIHLAHARESDAEAHCVVRVCAEAAAGVLTVETEAEIDS